ncbi:hypothetical protein D3C73_1596710 [compost metagenome]
MVAGGGVCVWDCDGEAESDGLASGSPWFISIAHTAPPSTITSRAIRAISGQVHGLFFFFFSSAAASSVGS